MISNKERLLRASRRMNSTTFCTTIQSKPNQPNARYGRYIKATLMSLSTSRFFLRTAFTHQSLRTTTINKPLYTSFQSRGFRSTVANMGVHNIASKAELQTVLDGSVDPNNTEIKPIVVLDAFATWCGPCKVIAPTIAAWSENAYKHVHFIKVDVDEVPDVAQELGIRAMPTFVIFKDGKPVKEVVGANPKALENWIKEFAGEGVKAE